jgi:hypothetical protein
MRRKKCADQRQQGFFTNVPPPKPQKPPRRRTFAYFLAKADAAPTPPSALGLPPELQRLARLCRVLADDAKGDFQLGVTAAGAVVGGEDSTAGTYALRALQAAGLVVLVRRGSPGKGVSVWRWCGDRPAGLRFWNDQAALVAAVCN